VGELVKRRLALARRKNIMAVKTISYKGKPYVEVAERVKQVHSLNQEFQVLESEPLEIVGRVVWRVTISVNGKIYKGSAEAKLTNAVPRSADETNPFECAETSALGRALAFAGLGTVDGIASYDEIARGQSPEQLAQDQQPPTQSPTAEAAPQGLTLVRATHSNSDRITPNQISSIKNLCNLLGREVAPDIETMSFENAKSTMATLGKQWQEHQASIKNSATV
jgi:hypothetical protein